MDFSSIWNSVSSAQAAVQKTVNDSKATENVSEAFSFLKNVTQDALLGGSEGKLDPEELNMTFITPRIIIMGLPSSEIWIKGGYHIDHAAAYLKTKFAGKFMLWNMSEKLYDYTKFNNNVLEFNFPGYAAAPLPLVFSMCDSLHGWLNADSQNVAIVHCLSGTGRSVSTVATYLSWAGLAPSPHRALQHISKVMKKPLSNLLIPSQQRYLGYFSQLLEGKEPQNELRCLQRVIIKGIPAFENDGSCRPYLQIFKDAKLLYTSTGKSHLDDGLRWYTQQDDTIFFPVNQVLEGDILIRIRHYSRQGKRISMMRFGFYTGFLEPGPIRLTKHEIDGACDSDKFPDDFFVDLSLSAVPDEQGQPTQGTLPTEFWTMVSQRKEPSQVHSSSFTLLGGDDDVDVEVKNQDEAVSTFTPATNQGDNSNPDSKKDEATSNVKALEGESEPEQASLEDLERYLRGLGDSQSPEGAVTTEDVSHPTALDSDDELLHELTQLQKSSNSGTDSDIEGMGSDLEGLDMEAALAQLNASDDEAQENADDDDFARAMAEVLQGDDDDDNVLP